MSIVQCARVAAALQAVAAVVLVAAGQANCAAVDGLGDGEHRCGALLVEVLALGRLCDLAWLELGCIPEDDRVAAVLRKVSTPARSEYSKASPRLPRSMHTCDAEQTASASQVCIGM